MPSLWRSHAPWHQMRTAHSTATTRCRREPCWRSTRPARSIDSSGASVSLQVSNSAGRAGSSMLYAGSAAFPVAGLFEMVVRIPVFPQGSHLLRPSR
jgi:hypothetical protein